MSTNVENGSVATSRLFRLRLPCLLLVLAGTFSSTGCTLFQGINEYIAYNETCDDAILGWRNYVWSWQAWRCRRWMFVGEPQFNAFGEGFRAGYVDVATGGKGCPPAIPPREYWSYSYQTAEGQAKIAAWFAGFPHGAQTAREDGAGSFRDIPVAGETDAMYSQGYRNGQCPGCREVHLAPPMEGDMEIIPVPEQQMPNPPTLDPPQAMRPVMPPPFAASLPPPMNAYPAAAVEQMAGNW